MVGDVGAHGVEVAQRQRLPGGAAGDDGDRPDHLGEVDEAMVEYIRSPAFDDLLVQTVRSTFPSHEHEHFIAHYRGLLGAWADDQKS